MQNDELKNMVRILRKAEAKLCKKYGVTDISLLMDRARQD